MQEDQQNDQQKLASQPGSVINPGARPAPEQSASLPPAPEQPVQEAPQQAVGSVPEADQTQATDTVDLDPEPDTPSSSVTWTASEFIAHEKSSGWYLSLAVASLVAAGLVFFLTKGLVSSVVIIVAAIILGVYAKNKPRQLKYQLDEVGLTIEGRVHPYEEFKSFSIVPEGGFSAINFMPLKRFSPILTVYYSPDDEKKIASVLTRQLPYDEARRDAVDSLMKRIRF